ncbi:MAG: hypothetical protein ACRC6B_03900, partial [Fusobacteriaceae bacterium]
GGNKVYFQNATPPTSGVGVKDGDMWFKTNENNKMFILINGVWTLADDAKDSIEQGRVVINANTTFNGDATFISKGSNETTVIKDGSITFTRDGLPVTVIRNMRFGTATASSTGGDIVTLAGFKDSSTSVLPSLRKFNVSANLRSLECRPTRVGVNQWRFFLAGTENTVIVGDQVLTTGASKLHSAVYSATLHKATVQTKVDSSTWTESGYSSNKPTLPNSYSAEVKFVCKVTRNGVTSEIKSFTYNTTKANMVLDISEWFPYTDGNTKGDITFSIAVTTRIGRTYGYNIGVHSSGYPMYTKWITTYTPNVAGCVVTNITTSGSVDLTSNYAGSGEVQYIAFEG